MGSRRDDKSYRRRGVTDVSRVRATPAGRAAPARAGAHDALHDSRAGASDTPRTRPGKAASFREGPGGGTARPARRGTAPGSFSTLSQPHMRMVVLIISRGVSTATTFENSTKRLGTVNARVEDVEAAAIRKDEPSLFGVVLVV